ncbi:Acyl-CoA dehydrogenase family member 9, mitochondrial [Araneus ventricosus]|uniref:Acyl-CoA dehydrogenase family member 9, mitochondrial n=1 Tax=Araneus ventricosus TaxID=182803 RepID=A0A4Y2GPH8_ARAVE|nr:Acyl-CoA dehydrogenase family member 9, mitochondrial [Araneus ventricosus]
MESSKILWPALKYSNRYLLKFLKHRHCGSLSSVWRNYSSEHAQTQEVISREKIQLSKPSIVKWKRPPFLKDIFLGKLDVELLAFPEILAKEQVTELEDIVKILNDFMIRRVNSQEIDRNAVIPEDVLQELKEMGLFGRIIPEKYGGLGLSYTASTRLNEVLGLDWSIASTLATHEFFAAEALLHFGSETQKSHYLPKMASGEIVGAYCAAELESGSDLLSMSTVAKSSGEGHFLLSGRKSWVSNAGLAGLFIVFAKTDGTMDPKHTDISAFLVDRNSKGVTVTMHDKVCLRGLQTGMVHFDDVVVTPLNILGGLGQGFNVYLKSLESFRFAMNSFTFGALKSLLDSVTEHIIHCERLEKSLADYQLVRMRLSRITNMIYGMETASYFTAAILDSTEKPDITLESTALKIFNSEATLYCLRELMDALGSSSLMPGSHFEKFHRDAIGLTMFDSPNDVARLYLGLQGCKHVGDHQLEKIRKLRNPFFYPFDIMKEHIRQLRIRWDLVKYDQDIAGHVHPSLVEWGNKLEKCLQNFEGAPAKILSDHGKKVVETQLDPRKLADIAKELYVWAAVLSRCSRSYCLGMKNSHHELRLAGAFCYDAFLRLAQDMDAIAIGIARNNERNHLVQGEQIVDCRGYFPEHPLKHNF